MFYEKLDLLLQTIDFKSVSNDAMLPPPLISLMMRIKAGANIDPKSAPCIKIIMLEYCCIFAARLARTV